MPIFNDPRLDPVDINSSEEYFTGSTDHRGLDSIYAMWLEAYRQVWAWYDAHASATSDEARAASEAIFARVCHDRGIPRRMGGMRVTVSQSLL
jgi:hypothetical protein